MADGPLLTRGLVGQARRGAALRSARGPRRKAWRRRKLPMVADRSDLRLKPRLRGEALLSAAKGSSARTAGEIELGRRTAGSRGPVAAQVPRGTPGAHWFKLLRVGRTGFQSEARRPGVKKIGSSMCSQERCAGRPRLRAGGFSQLKLSVKNKGTVNLGLHLLLVASAAGVAGYGIEFSKLPRPYQAWFTPQRFPTVRRVSRLGNWRINDETAPKMGIAHSPCLQRALHCWRLTWGGC